MYESPSKYPVATAMPFVWLESSVVVGPAVVLEGNVCTFTCSPVEDKKKGMGAESTAYRCHVCRK